MKKYLVGGAVRDLILNQPVIDQDWVIVGAKAQDLLNLGFNQVGKDFPVFLHPETKEEYALARTERKSGKGYTGFVFDFNENITLEQDLERRDLTINAIAMDENNQFIDPFNGIADINQRVLRHISPAFAEDPLRVLRVARFAARFHHLGFTIAPETMQLMQSIVEQGEIETLTAERVWLETEKALKTKNPQIFFSVLKKCHALNILFPEIARLFTQSLHQQNLGQLTFNTLKYTSQMTNDPVTRFAALCCHINAIIQQADFPSRALTTLDQLYNRFKIPTIYKKIANIANRYYQQVDNIERLSAAEVVDLLNHIDVWRNPQHLQQLLFVCYANAKATYNDDKLIYQPKNILEKAYQITKAVSIQAIIAQGFVGKGIQIELNHRRIQALMSLKN